MRGVGLPPPCGSACCPPTRVRPAGRRC